jgi:hypothetical protein
MIEGALTAGIVLLPFPFVLRTIWPNLDPIAVPMISYPVPFISGVAFEFIKWALFLYFFVLPSLHLKTS